MRRPVVAAWRAPAGPLLADATLGKANTFTKVNVPLGRAGMPSDQDAWYVATFMDAHERPQDPRYTGDLAGHPQGLPRHPRSLYGQRFNGHPLGSAPSR
jgi:thiosulfate dehydrogenase